MRVGPARRVLPSATSVRTVLQCSERVITPVTLYTLALELLVLSVNEKVQKCSSILRTNYVPPPAPPNKSYCRYVLLDDCLAAAVVSLFPLFT